MSELMIEQLNQRVFNLEKKIETYYRLLKIEDELDFVLNGNYYLNDEIGKILIGDYEWAKRITLNF